MAVADCAKTTKEEAMTRHYDEDEKKNIGRLRRRRRLITTQWFIIIAGLNGGEEPDFYTDLAGVVYADPAGVGYTFFEEP